MALVGLVEVAGAAGLVDAAVAGAADGGAV